MKPIFKILIGIGIIVILLSLLLVNRKVKLKDWIGFIPLIPKTAHVPVAPKWDKPSCILAHSEITLEVSEQGKNRNITGTTASLPPTDKSKSAGKITIAPGKLQKSFFGSERNNIEIQNVITTQMKDGKTVGVFDNPQNPLEEVSEIVNRVPRAVPKQKISSAVTDSEDQNAVFQGIHDRELKPAINAIQPEMTPPLETPAFLDQLKVACDFQSLGIGYKVFQVKKAAIDVLAYTDKAGVGLSFKLNDFLHLGIDETFKYTNGEPQIRFYFSVPLGAPR